MHKYRSLDILILLISIIFITSACSNKSVNDNVNVPSMTKAEPNSDNDYKNINNTTVLPSNTNMGKEQGVFVIGHGENNIKDKIMGAHIKQLSDEDFGIVYKSIHINQNTKIEDITKELGFPNDYEENNQGYISGNAKYRRWNLCYPDYRNPEIRMIILSEREYFGEEVKDGNSYIEGIYLETYETNKGLKVGDKLEKVLQIYGRPQSYGNSILQFSKGDFSIEITVDEATEKVDSIFIDYNKEWTTNDKKETNN